ncbi:hypothetical protein B0H14DRAFT_3877054 [Mycena olivaceomarginata]|nr:hypothetical protein B0H14DRAFT_3877054 [Mycena olivaceomarginata]
MRKASTSPGNDILAAQIARARVHVPKQTLIQGDILASTSEIPTFIPAQFPWNSALSTGFHSQDSRKPRLAQPSHREATEAIVPLHIILDGDDPPAGQVCLTRLPKLRFRAPGWHAAGPAALTTASQPTYDTCLGHLPRRGLLHSARLRETRPVYGARHHDLHPVMYCDMLLACPEATLSMIVRDNEHGLDRGFVGLAIRLDAMMLPAELEAGRKWLDVLILLPNLPFTRCSSSPAVGRFLSAAL